MLATLVLTLAIAGVAAPALPQDSPVRILTARGSVSVVRGAGLPSTAAGGVSTEPGSLLVAGDRILLGEKALINIQDPAGMLQLSGPGEANMVSLSHYQWQGDRAVIAAQSGPVQISVAGGTVHVAAGTVRLRRNAAGWVVIESLREGQAAVVGPAGIAALKPGAGILLHQAGPTAKTTLLPAATELLLPRPHALMGTFRFQWRAVPDAASYRLELSRDPLFQDIIYARESTTPVIAERARSLPVGLLFWRVATRSEEGFEGFPSEARAIRVAP